MRRIAGPDPALITKLLASQAEVARVRRQLAECDEQARATQRGLDKVINRLLEPPVGACTKVRLRNRAEAEGFARLVERETLRTVGSLEAYRCETCPRQPIIVEGGSPDRFWHIANADPRERSSGSKVERKAARARKARQSDHNGSRLQDRLDPAVLQRLRGEQATEVSSRISEKGGATS